MRSLYLYAESLLIVVTSVASVLDGLISFSFEKNAIVLYRTISLDVNGASKQRLARIVFSKGVLLHTLRIQRAAGESFLMQPSESSVYAKKHLYSSSQITTLLETFIQLFAVLYSKWVASILITAKIINRLSPNKICQPIQFLVYLLY